MDILPLGSAKIYSFLFARSRDRKPAEDFSELCNVLGNAWWGEMKRTNRGYLASRHVLDQAAPPELSAELIRPEVVKIPVGKGAGKSLLHLKLDRAALQFQDTQADHKIGLSESGQNCSSRYGG